MVTFPNVLDMKFQKLSTGKFILFYFLSQTSYVHSFTLVRRGKCFVIGQKQSY